MSERCQDTSQCRPEDPQETLSIHTQKITDSCRDKDCIEDLRVYLTCGSQAILDSCATVRVRCAELLHASIDVEPVAFDRTHYCIDVTFYYRIVADATLGAGRPAALCGLAVFSKRAVLCGEDSRAHVFTSRTRLYGPDGPVKVRSDLPTAVVEVLDPMVLSSRVTEACDRAGQETCQVPPHICSLFDEELVLTSERRRLYVTLGQFSIIRLERDAQLVVPVVDWSIPTKECCDAPGCADDPCEMFSRIPFPADRFTPKSCDKKDCGCCGES